MASHTLLPHSNDGYVTGQLLVATPQIQFSCFHRSVVYMVTHKQDGAMGFIINQPLQHISLRGVMEHFKLPVEDYSADQPIYFGGPVDTARGFVIHSSDYSGEGTIPLNSAVSLSSGLDVLKEIVFHRGPMHHVMVLGHAGWGPGQLEAEMKSNSWITVPATEELLFGGGYSDKWMLSNRSLGIDPYRISDAAGHA